MTAACDCSVVKVKVNGGEKLGSFSVLVVERERERERERKGERERERGRERRRNGRCSLGVSILGGAFIFLTHQGK